MSLLAQLSYELRLMISSKFKQLQLCLLMKVIQRFLNESLELLRCLTIIMRLYT